METVGEKDPLQRVRSRATFAHPVSAAIDSMQDDPFIADSPTFNWIQKLNVQQVDRHARTLWLPTPAAIHSAINAATATHRPTQSRVNKRSSVEANSCGSRQLRAIPRFAPI